MSIEEIEREVVELLNETSRTTNKMLATLNSGAMLACIHFCGERSSANLMKGTQSCGSSTIVYDPLFWFAIGLTAIIITAAANYFTWLLMHTHLKKNMVKNQNKCLFWIATLTAITSAISFLIGIWIVVFSA